MIASKSKLFAAVVVFSLTAFNLYPLAAAQAKTINLGASGDVVSIPGTILNSNLAGTGNRCLYVDASGNVSVKGFDCGSATGGDNLGDHTATQNIKLNSFWLSGDAGNEGVYVNDTGGVGINTSSIPAGLSLSVNGNMQTNGVLTLANVVYVGGGNRMITVDNNGVLGAAAIPTDTDIYWTGTTGGGFNAATARTSLGLGSLATLSSVSNAQINDVAWSKITNFPSACSAGQYVSAVGSALTCSTPAGGISGSGTANYVTRWTSGSALGNSVIYDNGTNVGVNNTSPGAKVQINATASNEGLRIVSASDWSPLNIRNSANSADIFRVDQAGSLAVGSIPWARLTSYPSACSAGQYVSAVGGTLTCSTPTDTNTDVYWTGTSTNLVAATARTSLGLGSLATLNAVSGGASGTITDATITDADISATANISASKIQHGPYFITSAGTSGQIWTSDGDGAGIWATDNGVTGEGTVGFIPYWNTAKSLRDSNIYYDQNNIGIGVTSPVAKLDVNGSLKTNSSVTFSALSGGGSRIVTVDNSGTLGATTSPIPSGTTSQTLRKGADVWEASSFLWNSGSTVGINYSQDACDPSIKLSVSGIIQTTGLKISETLPTGSLCPSSGDISFSSGVMEFSANNGFTFNNSLSVTGIINATTGFAYRGTAGLNTSFAANTVLTGVSVGGGIITAATPVTGLTVTVSVRKPDNTGVCALVFTKGILTSVTCPAQYE